MLPVGALCAIALLLLPTTAAAGRGIRSGATLGRAGVTAGTAHRFAPHARAPRSVFPVPVDPWKSWPPRTGARHARPHVVPFSGAPLVSSTLIVPDSYLPAFVTAPPPETGEVYLPPPVVPMPPAPPPVPALVEYADGWYQLRGDGVAEPYRWVWIPKPPASSPPAPSAPPATVAPRSAGEKPSVAYHWTDEGGVTTWTNRLDRVPKRYRERAVESAQPD